MTACGALFFSKSTGRFLFLLRNHTYTQGTWGMPGGKLKDNESLMQGLDRELSEEIGKCPEIIKKIPLETFTSMDSGFTYHSFIFVVESEFIPTLNDEHSAYAWCDLEKYPKPLHPGLWNNVNTEVIMDKIRSVSKNFR